VFEPGHRIRLNTSDWSDLGIRNHVLSTDGQCSTGLIGAKNVCGGELTVVWGRELFNAELIAVLVN